MDNLEQGANTQVCQKTEISSPIKDAIASHIDKWYPPKARHVEDKAPVDMGEGEE